MTHKSNSLLISALLWLSIFLLDTLTACSAVKDELKLAGPEDIRAPEIIGQKDVTVYEGTPIDYLEGVLLRDDVDADPVLLVDSSAVKPNTPGVYTAVYTACDQAGNKRVCPITVTILERGEGFAELEEVQEAVDRLLEQIVDDSMDTRKKVETIYSWAQEHFTYGDHSDRTDPYQACWQMLQTGTGDCYGYYSVCKLMFDRLGIPNVDVVKVKNNIEDSQHFWSLVSVDGGMTYYHFDATPRLGGGDFCLVTDAQLDAYSAAHKNSHNRNVFLYPATPEV